METLRFWPLESKVEAATFWSALGELKLHSLKLEEGPVPLRATWAPSSHASQPGLLTVNSSSLRQAASDSPAEGPGARSASGGGTTGAAGFEVSGELYVLNTAERMLKFDRKAAVQQACNHMWSAICSGAAERDPRLLQTAVLLTYCDLKHYKYRYWFAFPALQPPQPFALTAPPASLAAALGSSPAAAAAVAAACSDYAAAARLPAWLVCVGVGGDGSDVQTAPLTDWERLQQEQGQQQQGQEQQQPQQQEGGQQEGQQAVDSSGTTQRRRIFLAVADSSNLEGHPGWALRNLLLMAAARWQCRTLGVLCMRERRGRFDADASLALQLSLPPLPADYAPAAAGGWEPNERGKVGPRTADLAPAMDPRQLAEAAVELNLRLMRWRAAPALDVGGIAAARCLLLGAGTLGCSVARTLLGWGVRHLTFVDNSHVSYSNPVRQSLYNFEDCLAGGKPKAAAAAEAVGRIFPGVTACGVRLSVPMPGHPLSEVEVPQVLRDVAELEALVDAHHVVFLLTDTRESRWLPTLLCAARGRLAINAALGFSGFMVMRHGAPLPPPPPLPPLTAEQPQPDADAEAELAEDEAEAEAAVAAAGRESTREPAGGGTEAAEADPGQQQGQRQRQRQQEAQAATTAAATPAAPAGRPAGPPGRLGCYFCNDVVAPLDSTQDRSLDQQCTVARPGLSAIAGSLAVELMAAVLAHPLGAAAPPPGSGNSRSGWPLSTGDNGNGGSGRAAAAAAGAAAAAQRPPQQQRAGTGAGAEELPLPLGEPPHMIRGQLGGFSQMCLVGQAFRQCTACSPAVVAEYRRRGAAFILEGLLDPRRLEDLTGLTELHQASEAALEAWASSSSSSSECGEGESEDVDVNEDGKEKGGAVGQRGSGLGSTAAGGEGGGGGKGRGCGTEDGVREEEGEEEDWEEL